MDDLLFDDSAFDALWAEGSIFIMGFEEGLTMWKRMLRPGGYVCLTEAVWFTDRPSPEAVTFWNNSYPAITSVEKTCAKAESVGYEVLTTFPLPKLAWWENYYSPLEGRLPELKKAAESNPDAETLIAFSEREMAMHKEHGEEYGYQFFILKSH